MEGDRRSRGTRSRRGGELWWMCGGCLSLQSDVGVNVTNSVTVFINSIFSEPMRA